MGLPGLSLNVWVCILKLTPKGAPWQAADQPCTFPLSVVKPSSGGSRTACFRQYTEVIATIHAVQHSVGVCFAVPEN